MADILDTPIVTLTRDWIRMDEVSYGDVIDLGGADAEVVESWGSGFSYRVAGSEKYEYTAIPESMVFRLGRTV